MMGLVSKRTSNDMGNMKSKSDSGPENHEESAALKGTGELRERILKE